MSSLKKKILSVATAFALAGSLVTIAQAGEYEDLLAQIAALTEQLNALKAQLAAYQTKAEAIPSACSGITFTTNLKLGSKGPEVKCLQALLNQELEPDIALSGPGSAGNETTYFGPITKAGVIRFQEKYADEILAPWGLTKGTGFVGKTTRAKLNSLLVVKEEKKEEEKKEEEKKEEEKKEEEKKEEVSANLTITASATPAAGRVIVGNVSVLSDFTNLVFEAGSEDVTVSEITLSRSGFSKDSDVDTVYLYDGSTLVASGTLSDKKVRFASADLLTIPANTSKTITVKATLATTSSDKTFKFGVASASDVKSNVSVVGTFPANGNEMTTIKVDDLGKLEVKDVTGGGTSVDPGKTNYTVYSATLKASSDSDLEVTAIKFTNLGTCDPDDLQNLKLTIDGVQKGETASSLASDGTLSFDFSASPIEIKKSKSVDLVLAADIEKGSKHTFQFSIEEDTDIIVVEKDYGVTILAVTTAGATAPFTATATTINPGTLTVKKSSDSPTENVVLAAENVTLAKFDLKATGEDLQIKKLVITANATSTNAVPALAKGRIYLDGNWIGSEESLTSNGAVTFDNLNKTIPAGETQVLEVRANIASTDSSKALASGDKIQIKLSSIYVKKLTSKEYETYYAAGVEANTLTVGKGSLKVVKTATYGDQNITKSTSEVKIASFTLSAETGEDIKVKSIQIDLYDKATDTKMTDTTAFDLDWLSNLKISESSSVVATPSASETFTVSFTIPANSSKEVYVYADVSSDATAEKAMYVKATIKCETATSAEEVKEEDKQGQTITVKEGALEMALATDTPDSAIVLGGDTDVAMAKYTFKAKYEDFTVGAIKVEVTPPADFTKVWIASGGKTSAKQVVGADGTITFTDLPVTVPKDGEVDVSVYADINEIKGAAKSGDAPQVAIVYYKATSTSQTKEVIGTFAANKANAMVLYKTKPVVEVVGLSNTTLAATNANKDIFSFKVDPDTKGAVTIKGLQLAVAKNQITALSNLKIYYGLTEITASATSTDTTITFTGMTEKISSARTYVIKAGTITAPDANSSLTVNFDTNNLDKAFVWDDNSGYGVTTADATYLRLPTNSVTLSR